MGDDISVARISSPAAPDGRKVVRLFYENIALNMDVMINFYMGLTPVEIV